MNGGIYGNKGCQGKEYPYVMGLEYLFTLVYKLRVCRVLGKGAPRQYPIHRRMADHIPAPRAVNSENPARGMRAIPAGRDINCLTTGIRRQIKVVISPYSRKISSALEKAWGFSAYKFQVSQYAFDLTIGYIVAKSSLGW